MIVDMEFFYLLLVMYLVRHDQEFLDEMFVPEPSTNVSGLWYTTPTSEISHVPDMRVKLGTGR
jgi:hypothetical protein